MNKNYTLKITLAMLVAILISIVSFVGVYKGKSLMKDYSLGKDLSQRYVARYTVVEEEKEDNATDGEEENNDEENAENKEEVKEESPEEKNKKFINSKNIIEKRLASMRAEDFEVRLEDDGTIEIEVPTSIDTSILNEIMSKGKIEIKNISSGEVIMDSSAIKSASTSVDSTTYIKPMVLLNVKFTKEAKEKVKSMDGNYTDSEGKTTKATYAITIDGQTLYSDSSTPGAFIESAKNGSLDLVVGSQGSDEDISDSTQIALVRVAQLNNGTLDVEYKIDTMDAVKSNINVKAIILAGIIISGILFVYALIKFKNRAVLPMLSIVGMVAALLLTLRYTNVKITLFSILGIGLITLLNYILVIKSLKGEKSFKTNMLEMIKMIVPCVIVAIVFCCSPYIQVSSLGMTMFWGLIVLGIYNLLITRVLVDK